MSQHQHERANPLVEQLLGLLDHTLEESPDQFGTQHWHSLLWNLHNVRQEDWDTQPAPGSRTIREIVTHIGIVYLAYESHIFGDGTRSWDDPTIDGVTPGSDPEEMMTWLRRTHAQFRNSVASLTDSRLSEPTSWGEPWTYQRVIEILIQHPIYHIGEINYARAILQGNNDWAHMDLGRDPEE